MGVNVYEKPIWAKEYLLMTVYSVEITMKGNETMAMTKPATEKQNLDWILSQSNAALASHGQCCSWTFDFSQYKKE